MCSLIFMCLFVTMAVPDHLWTQQGFCVCVSVFYVSAQAFLNYVCASSQQGFCVCSSVYPYWCVFVPADTVLLCFLMLEGTDDQSNSTHTCVFLFECVFSQQGFSCCNPADWRVGDRFSYHSNLYIVYSAPNTHNYALNTYKQSTLVFFCHCPLSVLF
ncbi:hypothetical protein GOODEAATRI_015480 [Goodea atripinnis]|uniref:Secreted protein n=1 Tax=Goodea atripinnis TaxID=208336 RepID=A0ABV0P5H7_9TELE